MHGNLKTKKKWPLTLTQGQGDQTIVGKDFPHQCKRHVKYECWAFTRLEVRAICFWGGGGGGDDCWPWPMTFRKLNLSQIPNNTYPYIHGSNFSQFSEPRPKTFFFQKKIFFDHWSKFFFWKKNFWSRFTKLSKITAVNIRISIIGDLTQI